MDIFTALLVVVSMLNFGLAVIVLRAGSRRETNRVFALAAFSVTVWALTNAGFRAISDESALVLLSEVSYVSAVVLGSAFLHFSWTFPRPRDHIWLGPVGMGKRLNWISATVISAFAFLPGFMVVSVDLNSRSILTGPGVYLVAVHMVVTTCLAFVGFWRHQSRRDERTRAQARFVLYGAFLTAACGLTFNLALPLTDNYHYVWAGPASSVLFVGFSVFAIIKHDLFDIRKLIQGTVMISFILAALSAILAVLGKATESQITILPGGGSILVQAIAALVVTAVVNFINRNAEKLVKRWLFRHEPKRAAR